MNRLFASWRGVLTALALTAGPALAAGRGASGTRVETSSYEVAHAEPWRWVRPAEQPGYRVVLSTRDGRTLAAEVVVDDAPLLDRTPFPLPPRGVPRETEPFLSAGPSEGLDHAARRVAAGATTALEAVERIIAFTAGRIQYELPRPGELETATSCLARGRGSCVGRSLLAVELLRRSGIPARSVTGVLAAESASEVSPDSRAVYDATLGGVLHRWIEAYVPGLGWVPSDPGGLANTVTSRHLALAGFPPLDFGVRLRHRAGALRWSTLEPGRGPALARERRGMPHPRPVARREAGDVRGVR